MKRRVKYKKITLRLPEKYVEDIDYLVKQNRYESRSEAIRRAVSILIRRYLCYIKPRHKRMIA